MSDQFTVMAKSREDAGKGASRRLRREHNSLPAIVYGGDKTAQKILLDHNKIVRSLQDEAFYSHILNLNIDGKVEQVVLKDIQRHPAKRLILHMDFLRIKAGEQITMHVPIHFLNEEKSAGVKAGGVVTHMMNDIEITCLPKDLPEFINIDLAALKMDDIIHLSAVEVPKGVTFTAFSHGDDADPAVVSIHKPRSVAADSAEPTADDEVEDTASE